MLDTYEKTLNISNIYTGKVINLDIETVLLPNNKEAKREIVKHPGAVAILPINDKGEIFFVKQYRKAINMELIEIPAGKLEKNEEPKKCALRELQEEIGYMAGKLTFIGEFYTSPGFANEKIFIYKAEELTPNRLTADEDEFINIIKYDKYEAVNMVKEGIIKDAKTVLAICLSLKQ